MSSGPGQSGDIIRNLLQMPQMNERESSTPQGHQQVRGQRQVASQARQQVSAAQRQQRPDPGLSVSIGGQGMASMVKKESPPMAEPHHMMANYSTSTGNMQVRIDAALVITLN